MALMCQGKLEENSRIKITGAVVTEVYILRYLFDFSSDSDNPIVPSVKIVYKCWGFPFTIDILAFLN